jgi:hypothetical protein
MAERKRLSDILLNSEREHIAGVWANTKPAADLKPIPADEYRCRVMDGVLFTAQSGTPGYKLTLEVVGGEHAGRRLWHDIWLSEASISIAKRDLAKLGVTDLEQLERPLPEGMILKAKVVIKRGDNGGEFNRVTRFELAGIEPPEPEPFAPLPDAEPRPAPAAAADRDESGLNEQASEQQDATSQSQGRGGRRKP